MSAYKDEKHGTWYVKFSYVDWKGDTRWTTKRGFKGKRAAEKYEREFKDAEQYKQHDITVGELAQHYLNDKKIQLRVNSYRARESVLAHHILPYLGKLKLSQLTPLRMKHWQNEIIREGNTRNHGGKLSRSTILMINSLCSILLNYAVKFYGMKQNPLRIIGAPNIPQTVPQQDKYVIWSPEEFSKALEFVDDIQERCIFEILFYAGLRIGELLALNAEDFDFKANTISITKSYNPTQRKVMPTKTVSSVRSITMPQTVMNDVRFYIEHVEPVSSPLFTIAQVTIRTHLNNIADKAGLKRIRLHDLRHSHASYLIHLGVPITTISRRLGHKNSSITLQVYSHMYKNADADLAKMLEDKIKRL